ncbi:MAG TPA: elongation factor P [Candidatus Paceibacterota bacterium]
MLDYNDIKPKKFIVLDGEPFEVMESHVFRKQQRKPVNATKLKNLITGGVREHSFAVSDKVDEAEIEKREVIYLYNNKNEYWFCEVNDKSKRFKLEPEKVAAKIIYVKPNSNIKLLTFNERLLGIEIPIKIDLRVKEAAPAVRGNTVSGGVKQVVLETGLTVNVPMFINEGDVIRINTETGEYVERK